LKEKAGEMANTVRRTLTPKETALVSERSDLAFGFYVQTSMPLSSAFCMVSGARPVSDPMKVLGGHSIQVIATYDTVQTMVQRIDNSANNRVNALYLLHDSECATIPAYDPADVWKKPLPVRKTSFVAEQRRPG
jgi:hypothetical protein